MELLIFIYAIMGLYTAGYGYQPDDANRGVAAMLFANAIIILVWPFFFGRFIKLEKL